MRSSIPYLLRIGVAALLLCTAPGARAQLSEQCTVSVLNRNVQVNPDGSWVLPNVPANFGQVRARATCVQNGVTTSGESAFFTLLANGVVNLPEVILGAATPIPVSLGITPANVSFTTAGQTHQLVVTATYPDRSVKDITAASAGTSYTTSNPALVTVSADGLVTAVASGTVVVSATHEGAQGLIRIQVVLTGVDSDGDGIPDDWEIAHGLNPNNPADAFEDPDHDGLTNLQEYRLGTDPHNSDTDGDGLTDGQEVALGTNPLLTDTDGDGIPDSLEVQTGSDPLNPTSFNLARTLQSIEVTPAAFVLTVNTIIGEASRQLKVTGHLIDGRTTLDLTSTAKHTNYTSSNLAVCKFGAADGRVFAGQDGTCTITITNSGFAVTAIGTVKTFAPRPLSFVSIPGFANNVDVSGNFAYVAAGVAGLQVVDVTDRRAPRIVASLDTPGNANDVQVVGNRAYVADGSAGLQVIDITDPTHPQLLGTLDTPGDASGVAVANNLVFIADGLSGVQIIDASNPTALQQLGSVDTSDSAKGVAVAGNLAVVATGVAGIQVIDMTNSIHPTILGSQSTGGYTHDVVLSGNFALVADSFQSFTSIDLGDPRHPVVRAFTPFNTGGLLQDVALMGRFAFGADVLFVNGVPIIDISNPANPLPVAFLDFSTFRNDKGTGIAVDTTFIYLTAAQGRIIENGTVGDTRLYIGQYLAIEDTAGIPPTVSITAPASSDTLIEGQTITLRAEATDDIAVAAVSFLVNGQVVFTDTVAPFEVMVTVPAGATSLTLGAQAIDLGSNVGIAQDVVVNVIPDPGTTAVGRIVDVHGNAIAGAAVTCLGVLGTTGSQGTFSIPSVSTLHGDILCTVTFVTPDGRTLTRTVDGGPPVRGGMTQVGTIAITSGLLFSTRADADGVPGSGVTLAQATGQTAASVFQETSGGSNRLVVDGLALGIQAGSNIDALDVLADGSFIFSIDFNTQGVPGSAVEQARGTGLREANIYRSTGNGTNELFLSGDKLGIVPFSHTNLDALALLPDGSVLFSVQPRGSGVPGSALAASSPKTRAMDIFRSFRNGTNELFRSAADLGLVSGDLIGLVWNSDGTLLFSVAYGTQGVPGSAVAAAEPNSLDSNIFLTAADGTNELFRGPTELGVFGPVDALASSPSPTADTRGVAPTVRITAPLPGQEVIEHDRLEIQLSVSDDVAVAAAKVVVGGTTVATIAFPGPALVVQVTVPPGPGPLAISAIATDLGGATGTDAMHVTVIPDPETTVRGRQVVDPDGHPVAGATVTCLGVAGRTEADGTFSIPGVPTIQGNVRCTVTFVAPGGQTLTGTAPGVPPVPDSITDVAQIHLRVTVGIGMVVDNATKSVIVFDATTDMVVGTVAIGSGLVNGDCAMTADGTRGFATDFSNRIWVIDLTTSPPSLASGRNPIPIANPGEDASISPDGKFLLICDGGVVAPVSVIDIATQTQIRTLSLNSNCSSVEVLHDGSVLTTSWNTVRRLMIDSIGTLTDTGETLFSSGGPLNAYGAPGATSGFVVLFASKAIQSFTIPGLTPVDTRPLSGLGGGFSGVVHPAGDEIYVRSAGGAIDAFAYNPVTGALSTTPLWSIPIADASPFSGIDQMAITPDGSKLYVSQPHALVVYDANTGQMLTSISHPALVQPTGVCFAASGAH